MKKRFQEGCRNAALLYREIKAQGYRGGSATVRRLLRSWKDQLPVRYQRLSLCVISMRQRHAKPYGGC